jgi:hypothetical protein
LGDASFALRGALVSDATPWTALTSLEAFAVATAIVAGPLLFAVAAGALLLGPLRAVTIATQRFLVVFSADRPTFGAAVVAASLAAASTRIAMLGRRLILSMSPHLAATLLVALAMVAVPLALLVSALVLRVLGPLLPSLERRVPGARFFTRGAGSRILLGAVLVIGLDALLLRAYVIAPAAGIVAWLASSRGIFMMSLPTHSRRARAFVAVLVLGTFAAPAAVARLPGDARARVAQRPPYGSLLLATARRLVDKDGDGYSPILGGGDCDDTDPMVHPGARDIPGNGRDENCSGADAAPYAASVLLMRVPNCAPGTIEAPVLLTDVSPTLLELARAPLPANTSAWPLGAFLFGPSPLPERPIFLYVDDVRAGVHYEARAIVDKRLKFVRDLSSGVEQLFDLEHDPGETRDVKDRWPANRAHLAAVLDGWAPRPTAR